VLLLARKEGWDARTINFFGASRMLEVVKVLLFIRPGWFFGLKGTLAGGNAKATGKLVTGDPEESLVS